jgi:hypothetical protein
MRLNESGYISLKSLFYLLFLAAVIYAGFKIIPVYVNNYQLEDYMRTQTPFWLTDHASAEAIRKNIVAKARDLDLPLAIQEVKVDASANRVAVSLDYSVPVDLKVYTLQLHFTPSSENRSI